MSDHGEPTADDIEDLTARVRDLCVLQDEVVAATKNLQALMLFSTHPDLGALDESLDLLYPDAGQ